MKSTSEQTAFYLLFNNTQYLSILVNAIRRLYGGLSYLLSELMGKMV